jgi:hypothetical protein
MRENNNMTDDVQPKENEITPSWYLDEGVPGVGDRPAWLPEKFKTAADLSKSYSELEKKFGSAPEEYDFTKSKYLDPDYAPFQDLKQLAKEKRVPKEVMDKMLESVDKYMDEFNIDYSEEVEKLGDNGKERVTILDNWAKANLSKTSYEALTSNLKTAEAIQALEELRGRIMSTSPQIPNGNDGAINSGATVEDIKIEMSNNLEKFKADPKYRKDIQARLEVAAKTYTGYIDKVGA